MRNQSVEFTSRKPSSAHAYKCQMQRSARQFFQPIACLCSFVLSLRQGVIPNLPREKKQEHVQTILYKACPACVGALCIGCGGGGGLKQGRNFFFKHGFRPQAFAPQVSRPVAAVEELLYQSWPKNQDQFEKKTPSQKGPYTSSREIGILLLCGLLTGSSHSISLRHCTCRGWL